MSGVPQARRDRRARPSASDAEPTWEAPSHNAFATRLSTVDRRFAEYRRRAVPAAALDPEGEDTTVPELLGAALTAWIAERDADQSYMCDPPPGRHVMLHARMRQSLDARRRTNGTGHFAPSPPPMPSPHRIASKRHGAQRDSVWDPTGDSSSDAKLAVARRPEDRPTGGRLPSRRRPQRRGHR